MATVLFTSNNYSSGTAVFTPSDPNFAETNLGAITFPYTFDPMQFGLPEYVIEGDFVFTTSGCVFTKTVTRLATTTLATAATTQATNGTAATTQATNGTAATTQATQATAATTQATAATTEAPVNNEVYYFHLGAEGYPYAQDLINGQLFKSDDSIAANYTESFEDMLDNPGKYEPVGTLASLLDKTEFTMPASVTSNFYWIAVPESAGVPDLTLEKHLEIDGAPADIAKAKLDFSRKNGEGYVL